MGNKIKYGLKNVHYAKITNTSGTIKYATPVGISGAVSMSISPDITRTAIAADDNPEYAVMTEDNGYTGDIEFQDLTDEDREVLFGSTVDDTDGCLIENKDDVPNPVALLFEFSGDAAKTRHVLYNCLFTKPSVEGETGKNNKTDKCSFTARPAEDTGDIKAKVSSDKVTKYNNWFSKVYVKGASGDSADLHDETVTDVTDVTDN